VSTYAALLPLTYAGRPEKTTVWTPKARAKRVEELNAWFYGGGGLVLSGDAHQAFYDARSRLQDEQATNEEVRDAMSALRTELKIDLGVRHPDERHVPMAPSQAQRVWE
jgi:hypothetical protein